MLRDRREHYGYAAEGRPMRRRTRAPLEIAIAADRRGAERCLASQKGYDSFEFEWRLHTKCAPFEREGLPCHHVGTQPLYDLSPNDERDD
jgi:hypothetical protein